MAGSAALGGPSGERSARSFIRQWAGIAILWTAALFVLQAFPGWVGAVLLLVAFFSTARGCRVPFGALFRALFTPAGLIFSGIVAGAILLVIYRTDLIAKLPALATIPAGNLVLIAIAGTAIGATVIVVSHHVGAGARERLMREYGPRIAQVLAVPVSAVEASRLTKNRAGSLVLQPTPPGGSLMLGKGALADQRISVVMPEFVINAELSGSDRVVFDPIATDEGAMATRERLAESQGLVVNIEELGDDNPTRPGAQRWQLASEVTPTSGPRIDVLARARELSLVEFRPYEHVAIIAAVAPATLELRNRIASQLKVDPWALEIHVTGDPVTGSIEQVKIIRGPSILDPEKRKETWLMAVRSCVPAADGMWWDVDDQTATTGALVLTRRVDTLSGVIDYPWNSPVSFTSVPFGRDEHGNQVNLGLLETNLLLGGIPGGGKSGGLTAYLSGIARLEFVSIIGIDPKKVEQAGWAARFSKIVTEPDDVLDVLEALTDEMNRRYEALAAQGRKKLTPDMLSNETPLICVVIDELANLVSLGVDKARDASISTAIRNLVALGRAASIIIVTATQKPGSDVIPTSLRDLIQMRVAFATTNVDMTDTILGKGAGNAGGPAHEIAPNQKGVAYVLSEESRIPRRIRTYWVPDEEVVAIAERTKHLRVDLPWLNPQAPPEPPRIVFPETTPAPEVTELDLSGFDLSEFDAQPTSHVEPKPAPMPAPAPMIQW
jgi:hypothetical protein